MKKVVIAVLSIVAIVYFAATAGLWLLQDKLVFFPQTLSSENAQKLSEQEVSFTTADNITLRGWLYQSPTAPIGECRLLIYFGGNAEEASENYLENTSYLPEVSQLFVNYRGYGGSDGKPSAANLRDDALLIFDEITEKLNIPPSAVCPLGRSLGTHMAAYVAASRPVNSLIMITPFDSVVNVGQGRYPIFPVRQLLRHPFDTISEVQKISAPTLFILAEHDRVVPHRYTLNLIRHWVSPYQSVTIVGGTHNNLDFDAYWQALRNFINTADKCIDCIEKN